MERKTGEAFETKVSDMGVVETIFAVMGNIDAGGDMIHPGAFAKTFAERGHRVKVLDHHNAQSIKDIIGKPVELRELSKAELPPAVTSEYPEATGGAYAKVQLLMDTPEGEGAYKRIKAQAVDGWSFGYDALDKDFEQVKVDDKEVSVRNLRTLKLFELSPVIWPMNDATTTISAKDTPTEAKPWKVFKVEGKFCVYKRDARGDPVGDTLGCHDTEDEAEAQLAALYASEEGDKADKEMTEEGPVTRLGDVLQGSIHKTFTSLCDSWYVEGYLNREERITLSALIGDALDVLSNGIPSDIAQRRAYPYPIGVMARPNDAETKKDAPADQEPVSQQAAQESQAETQAGPDGDSESPAPPTSEGLSRRIRLERERLQLLEV